MNLEGFEGGRAELERAERALDAATDAMVDEAAMHVGGRENVLAAVEFARGLSAQERGSIQRRLDDPLQSTAAVEELHARRAEKMGTTPAVLAGAGARGYASAAAFWAGKREFSENDHRANVLATPSEVLAEVARS